MDFEFKIKRETVVLLSITIRCLSLNFVKIYNLMLTCIVTSAQVAQLVRAHH